MRKEKVEEKGNRGKTKRLLKRGREREEEDLEMQKSWEKTDTRWRDRETIG